MLQAIIIDYGMGNLRSVAKAFEAIGCEARVSCQPRDIQDARALVLPGVGAFGDGMANLRRLGLIDVLRDKALLEKTPLLGICLGMQLMAQKGFEDGTHEGLGWVPGKVQRLEPSDKALKIPHMGWNDIVLERPSPLLEGLGPGPSFYFLHSYRFISAESAVSIASCDYGGKFTACLQQDNLFGTQFHPEKSQRYGLQLLKNFVAIAGRCQEA